MSLAATPTMQRMNDDRIRFADIAPAVQGGKYPVKRLLGDRFAVRANIFRDGDEQLGAALRFMHESEKGYQHVPMKFIGDDGWQASFMLDQLGSYQYSIVAWTDDLATWQHALKARWEAGDRELLLEFQEGASLLRELTDRVPRGAARVPLIQAAMLIGDPGHPVEESILIALNPVLTEISNDFPDPAKMVATEQSFQVVVEPTRAGFAAWYQLFPRSQSLTPGKHGTLRDVLRRLPELRELGFDVLLLPPIHPIGLTNRKGKSPAAETEPNDVGSPWAVGNWQGGHDAIEPSLGSIDDFRMLIGAAHAHHIDVALELTLHCSPDHPYVKECPHWFKQRADGSFAYAEQPPGVHSDVYVLDFDSNDWPSQWQEILRITQFWIELGVNVFCIDSPHSSPVGMWDWLITQVKRKQPDVIFLANGMGKPAISHELARIGFSQCLSAFPMKSTKAELESHLNEVSTGELAQYFRPHFFTNTPDYLPVHLEHGSKAAFAVRLILAASLSPLYGIYSGFEFYEGNAAQDGSRRYQPSEIYELVQRPNEVPGSLKPLIKLINQTRRAHPSLQRLDNVTFHATSNPHLICYSKMTEDCSDRFVIVVNLDPTKVQEGFVELQLEKLGLSADRVFLIHDLLTNQTWSWKGARNYVRLDPETSSAHFCNVRVPVFKETGHVDLLEVKPVGVPPLGGERLAVSS
jgi:starch synthase (maltosyl-transferring)